MAGLLSLYSLKKKQVTQKNDEKKPGDNYNSLPKEGKNQSCSKGFFGKLAITGHFQVHVDDYLIEILRKFNHHPSGSIDLSVLLNTSPLRLKSIIRPC